MRFRTTILQEGKTAMGFEVPPEVVESLGAGKRPPVRVTINGYTYRNTVAVLQGRYMIGVSADHRGPAKVSGGDNVDVELELDTAPRVIDVPTDLAAALDAQPAARATFDTLSYSNKSWHVLQVTGTKNPETRARRVEKSVAALAEGRNPLMAVTYRAPGAVFTEREHTVPLDHANPGGPSITVFTREIADPDGMDRPYLLYLQGGPGFEAARPEAPASGWQKRALADYRLLMLDQRGTGRSTPVGDIPGETTEAQAAYLTHFRADSIVRDAELIRQELGVERWSVLGQSFGGFCTMSYLSMAPDGLREAFITGGLSPIGRPVDDVYAATYVRLIEKNRDYFARYAGDRDRVRSIVERLDAEDVRLLSGERLTARRFLQAGLELGMSDGFENIHHLVELPFGSRAFLEDAAEATSFGRNPIYATLHEACYADGGATRWSSARLLPDEVVGERYFTAEHIFPWMWDDYGALRSHREAAHALAEQAWPRLYDPDQLARNEVPVAATIYVNDLYVDRRFAEETASRIKGLRPWITNEYEHNGLRADGERIIGRLIDLARGRA